MKYIRYPAGFVLALGLAAPAAADDLETAAGELCARVKGCAMARVAQEDMSPEMRQMMGPVLEGMCASMRAGVQQVAQDHVLYAPAVACLRSMAALSCADFEDEAKVRTPACEAYQAEAEKLLSTP